MLQVSSISPAWCGLDPFGNLVATSLTTFENILQPLVPLYRIGSPTTWGPRKNAPVATPFAPLKTACQLLYIFTWPSISPCFYYFRYAIL